MEGLSIPLLRKTARFRAVCVPLAWLVVTFHRCGSESDLHLLSFSVSSSQKHEVGQGHMVSTRNREFIFKRSNASLGVEMDQ